MLIDHDELEIIFGTSTYRRGRRYYADGKVLELEISHEGASIRRLSAVVSGSGRNRYHTVVSVDAFQPGAARTLCSCPVGHRCKHAVAVVMAANSEQEQESLTAWQAPSDSMFHEWLKELQSLEQPKSASNDQLLYVLGKHRWSDKITVSCLKARRLKSGRPGKGKAVMPWARPDLERNPPAYIQDGDMEALCWARGLPGSNGENASLAHVSGAHFLEAAVRTGRLFWESPDHPPLQKSDDLDVNIRWIRSGADQWQLDLADVPDDITILPTSPLWYLNTLQQTVGRVQTAVRPETLAHLLEAPPISARALTNQLPVMQSLLQNLGIGLPDGIEAPTEIHGQPVPVLQLYTMPDPRPGSASLPDQKPLKVARLRFDYQDKLLAPHQDEGDTPVQLTIEDKHWLIHRDIGFEASCEEPLHDFLFLFELDPVWAETLPDDMALDHTLYGEDQWLDFLAWRLPELQHAGWRIEMDDTFDLPVIEAADWYGHSETVSENGWFDIEFGIEQDGHRINLIPLLQQGLQHIGIPETNSEGELQLPESLWLHDGESLIRVPAERVRPMLETLIRLFRGGQREGRLRLPKLDAARLIGSTSADWEDSDTLKALGEKLENFNGLDDVPVPQGLNAELRHYQQDGLNWLQFLRQYGLGGILADDMGLGKTLQTLAYLMTEKEAGRLTYPALVVCPTSVIPNWKAEARRFTPELSVQVIHGPDRHKAFSTTSEMDLVISSYPLLQRDAKHHQTQLYSAVFFDEGQNLKNPKTAAAKAARALQATNKFVLTGTPMENHLGELWALFDLVLPGYLGSEREFRELYRNPIEKSGSREHHHYLIRRIRPFLLRRTKDQVTPELPEKTEMVKLVELTPAQKDMYETIRASMDKKIRQLMENKGVARSQIEILEALLKLRQICCHPDLLKSQSKPLPSAKLDYLLGMVTELLEEGRRIIIFSQFTSMLALIETELEKRGLQALKLTGQTRDRETPVQQFQAGEVPLFLISLKAGGAGLNLTAADCVIHYDPWWNPAVEQQATDRAWRIGQDKPVFVYRLICEGTVEERMQALQRRKSQLAEGVYGNTETFSAALTAEDVNVLFQPVG